MTDYQELRRLAEQATPGPWRSFDDFRYTSPVNGPRTNIVPSIKKADAAYIAAANPATILDLIFAHDFEKREAEALARRVAALEDGLRAIVAEDYRGNEPSWYRKARSLLSEADATTSVKAQPSLSERSDLSSSGGDKE